MGARVSHMNIFAMSTIVQCNRMQFENILRCVEGRRLLVPILPVPTRMTTTDAIDGDDMDEEASEMSRSTKDNNNDNNNNSSMVKEVHMTTNTITATVDDDADDIIVNDNYMVSSSMLLDILQSLEIDVADIYLFQNLFTLADKRGYDLVDLKDLLTLFTTVFASSVEECLRLAIMVHDRQSLQIIDKTKLLHIFTLLNESCCYFGDMFLTKAQLLDLTDSIYTNAGKIDGDIVYMDFIQFMDEHPIVELLVSLQFQGTTRDKYLDDEEFSNIELVVDI